MLTLPTEPGSLLEPTPWKAWLTEEGWFRVSTTVDGKKVYFETRDGTLSPSAEAMAAMCLLPCMRTGAEAKIPMPGNRRWAANARKLAAQFGEWWGWDKSLPLRFEGWAEARPAPAGGAAAFYTGGVDSIHTLLNPSQPLGALVSVAGFDAWLKDEERLEWMEGTLRETAVAHGLEAIWIRTNLRGWDRFDATDWARTHGSAMAVVGHLLSHRFGTFLIPSTAPNHRVQHTGSNPVTDPLWGMPSVEFVYDGGNYDRIGKISRIARSRECHERLRVCWRNEPGLMNCGKCEKCLRTIITFLAVGGPLPKTLPSEREVIEHICDAEPIHANLLPLYEDLLVKVAHLPELRDAIRRWMVASVR
jgi:hypothetical protein